MRNARAFSLLEILVVLSIIAVVFFPMVRMVVKRPQDDWNTVLADSNTIISKLRHDAITKKTYQKLVFKVDKDGHGTITPMGLVPDDIREGKTVYKVSGRIYKFPEAISMKKIFIDNTSQNLGAGASLHAILDGMLQDCSVYLSRISGGKESNVTFKLKPFLGEFSVLNGFVKP